MWDWCEMNVKIERSVCVGNVALVSEACGFVVKIYKRSGVK